MLLEIFREHSVFLTYPFFIMSLLYLLLISFASTENKHSRIIIQIW